MQAGQTIDAGCVLPASNCAPQLWGVGLTLGFEESSGRAEHQSLPAAFTIMSAGTLVVLGTLSALGWSRVARRRLSQR